MRRQQMGKGMTNMIKLTEPAIPVFRIFDMDKAKEFYVDYLGFEIDWEHRHQDDFPVYMQISQGNLRIHLTEHHGDCTPGSSVCLYVEELDELVENLNAKGYRFMRPGVQAMNANLKYSSVTDPFGNKITLHERIPHDGH
jgi:catechol 2,3-dioxygenase-like lactoylglutathione lyase family enzyme|tara:strand:+ start:1118 stop:1537 length:420 start_codon:yes stop_codon:yes gene_type:complete